MKIFDLLQTKYTDFENQVKLYLSKTLSKYNENYGNNTIFGQLINVVGSTVQNMLLYVEDALTEQNKYTAQRKKSIYGLAVQSGYIPSLGKSASCNVKMMFQPNNYGPASVILKNKTQLICSYNGMKYCIVLPQEAITLSVSKDNSVKYIEIVEGSYETQVFSSTGGQLYTQTVLFNGDIDTDYLEVYINDELWEKRDSLYDMDPDGKQYTVKTSLQKGIDILFGNEQFGRALKKNDKITVTYLLHDGELGNIDTQEEVYFSFQDELTDINGDAINANEIFVIKLADENSVNGGTYSESTEKVKQLIGYNSRSLVLSDAKNYKVFLNRFSFVGYNRTWSDEGSLLVNSIVLRNYKQLISKGSDYFDKNKINKTNLLLTDAQKSSITKCIANSGQQLAGVTYQIVDPEICKYAAYVYLKMKDTQYDKTSVENSIRNTIGDFMCNVESDIFIPKSDFIREIKNSCDAIDGVDVYFISEKNETAIIDGKYIHKTFIFNPSKGLYDTTSEIVYIEPGTNPMLGLDEHGNIYLENNDQFPVLMGGWQYRTSKANETPQYATIDDPLIIVFR